MIAIDACGKIRTVSIWDQIDKLDDATLDELAYELGIGWYKSTADIATKREIIKASDIVHAKLGTPWAVEKLMPTQEGRYNTGYVLKGDFAKYFYSIQHQPLKEMASKKLKKRLPTEADVDFAEWLLFMFMTASRPPAPSPSAVRSCWPS